MIWIAVVLSAVVFTVGMWFGNRKDGEGHASYTSVIVPWVYRFSGCAAAIAVWFIYFAFT